MRFRLGAVTSLTPPQLATLRAVLDRLIPADEFPGALAAGTEHYVVRQWAGGGSAEAADLVRGLIQLDATSSAQHAGAPFVALRLAHQDALLSTLDETRDPFFHRLVDLTHEGFYADPSNGGNRDAVSWRMLGYDPHPSTGGAAPRLPSSSGTAASSSPPAAL